MATKKKNGRPATVERGPDEMRHIPLRMKHREVQRLDTASGLDAMSRTKWCHDTLLTEADARITREDERLSAKRAERRRQNAK